MASSPTVPSSSTAEIRALDRAHVWHPYAGVPVSDDPVVVTATDGIYLTLGDGRQVIDAMSSWWAAAHGHSHPHIVAAAHAQIDRMSHVMFGGLTHAPAAHLATRLAAMTGLERVFFSDSGSVAVEVALKIALQYARACGHPERTRLLTWRGGYHGDTLNCMSVCDPDGGMHAIWQGIVPVQRFAPPPPLPGSSPQERAAYLTEFAAQLDEEIAAVIIEPRVQGAGGMRFHDLELVAELAQLCRERDVLLIADEIATGFGRTGELFATAAAGVTPDILCVGKALTGGFMSLAATVTSDEIATAITRHDGALMHGPTFMGNPLACAVAGAALDLVEEGQWRTTVPRIAAELEQGLAELRHLTGVADVRVLGAIGVVELVEPTGMAAATQAALAEGVWLRPFGRLIYVMPPFISSTEEVAQICRGVRAAVFASCPPQQ